MKMKKICRICGREFETNHQSKIYCSTACREQRVRDALGIKVEKKSCLNCGRDFETALPNKKFCCKECQEKYREYSIELNYRLVEHMKAVHPEEVQAIEETLKGEMEKDYIEL